VSLLDDAPPSPPPIPSSPFGIGFRQPASRPSSPRLPSPSSSPESPSPTTGEPGWDSGPESDESDLDESPDPTPSPASTPESDRPEAVKVELFSDDELVALTRGGIAAAGEKAHEMFAVTPGQKHVDLYKTTEADQANIGDPLAAIAARHQGIGGKVNPDTKDALSMMVGLVGYATRQINLRNQARAIDAGALPPEPVDL